MEKRLNRISGTFVFIVFYLLISSSNTTLQKVSQIVNDDSNISEYVLLTETIFYPEIEYIAENESDDNEKIVGYLNLRNFNFAQIRCQPQLKTFVIPYTAAKQLVITKMDLPPPLVI